MQYVLFKKFTRVGGFYSTVDEAKKMATEKGIYNVCQVENNNGRLKIVTREPFRIS